MAPWFLHWMELLCVHSLMGGLTWSQSCRWFLCQSHCGTTLLLSCCHSFCTLYWEICHFLANQVLKIGSCKSKQASVSLLFDFGSYVWDGSFSGCKWVFSPLMALVHWGEYFEDSVISWSFLLQWVFATPKLFKWFFVLDSLFPAYWREIDSQKSLVHPFLCHA